MKIKRRLALLISKLVKYKLEVKNIEDEIGRHYEIIKLSTIPLVLLILTIVLFVNLFKIYLLDILYVIIFIYFLSSFSPDISYIFLKLGTKNPRKTFQNLRAKTHSSYGLVMYTLFLFFFLIILFGLMKGIFITIFGFLGYWLHLTLDKIEEIEIILKNLFDWIKRKSFT